MQQLTPAKNKVPKVIRLRLRTPAGTSIILCLFAGEPLARCHARADKVATHNHAKAILKRKRKLLRVHWDDALERVKIFEQSEEGKTAEIQVVKDEL